MKRFALTLAALLAASAVNAQIYQWKDENGKTVISDKPPVGNVRQQKRIEAEAPAPGNVEQKPLADREMEFRKRQQETREKNEKQQKEAAVAAENRENCERARRARQSLESGERIATRDANGERVFLDDAQREQEIGRMRQAEQNFCK